jgi:hypothetical protein
MTIAQCREAAHAQPDQGCDHDGGCDHDKEHGY